MKIPFYTYNMAQDRPTKYVIKFVPIDITVEEITDELTHRGIPILSVARLVNKRTKPTRPTQVILVSVKASDKEAITKLTTLCNLRIKVEHYTSTAVSQCFNCQSFGHSSANCFRAPVCVKCGQGHKTRECPISNNPNRPAAVQELIKCANCAGNHPASYRGCPAYKATLAKTVARKSQPKEMPKNGPKSSTPKQNFPALPKPKFVPAPPPKTNAWSNKPQKAATPSAPAPPAEETPASPEFSLKDVISMTKGLFDIKSVVSFIIKIVSRCKSEAKNFQDILTIALEEITGALLSFAN
jgi:hypothetical protein